MKKVSDVFDVIYGVNLEYYNMEPDENGIPFVSRTSRNNGVVGRVARMAKVDPNPKNTISVAVGGSVMASFLQEEDYYSGFHLLYLKPKEQFSINELLYYCMVLRENKYRYNYGRQANKTLGNILIPSIDEIPTWVNKISIPKKPTKESTNQKKVFLNDRDWKWFKYGGKDGVFKIKKGKRLTIANMEPGKTPFIGAIDSNNGYRDFIAQIPTHPANTITVNYNGSVAEAFYQPRAYWASDDCNIIYGNYITNYIAMFIITLIKLEKYRFNYGRKWHKERMEESKIKLPVTSKGQPDWEFMESYIKSLPYSKNLENLS